MNIIDKIRRWFDGEDERIDPDEPDTLGGMGVLHETRKRYSASARLARSVVGFLSRDLATKLTLLFAGISAVGSVGAWITAAKQGTPAPVPPVLRQDEARQKPPAPSADPHQELPPEHKKPSKQGTITI